MFRYILILLFAVFNSNTYSQTLKVSITKYHHLISSATVNSDGVNVYDGDIVIQNGAYSIPSEPDPSIRAYPMNNGSVILRENIANFLFYDTFGRVIKSISNSSQSEEGESISELVHDKAGKTVVIYNPKIVRNSKTGSRAKLINSNSSPIDIFFSEDRALRMASVSDNGELIALATMKKGTNDEVTFLDRFGNFLGVIEFDQNVKGVSFSENGLYATIFSGGRAAVYEIRNKQRVGSTSFRNTSLIFANYSSEDRTIVAITGKASDSFSKLEAHVVNITARKIVRATISGVANQIHKPILKRNGKGNYEIQGFDNSYSLKAIF